MRPKAIFFAILALTCSLPVLAAGPDDRERGEEDRIERRQEWFFSTRRAGTSSPADMARRRARAATETLRSIEAERGKRTLAAAAVWASRGPSPSAFGGWAFGSVSGRVTALARGGDGAVYAGTATGGLWRTTDLGVTWTSLFDRAGTMTIGAIAVDPTDPQVLWVGTGENKTILCQEYFGMGVLRSTDGGSTWELRNGGVGTGLEELATVADVVVDPRDPAHVVVGGRVAGCGDGTASAGAIYDTRDAGATWTKRLPDEFVHAIAQSPTAREVWWAATERGVFRSDDDARTWSLQTASGLPSGNTGRAELAIAPSDDRVVYATFRFGVSGTPEIWVTTDRGVSWTRKSTGSAACDGQCYYNMVLTVKVDDPSTVYRGNLHVFKSGDWGATWSDLTGSWGPSQRVHQDTHALLLRPGAPADLWVGSDGGVWRSTDGGATFSNANGNLSLTQFYAVSVDPGDPERICGGAQDNASLARVGSDVWSLQFAGGDGFVCGFNPERTSTAYAASYPGTYPDVYRSTTGLFGNYASITGAGRGIDPSDRIAWVTPYLLDPSDPSTLYLGTHKLYKSTNGGTSWTRVGPLDLTGGQSTILTIDVHPSARDVVVVGTLDGLVWRSTSGGSTFTKLEPGLPARPVDDLALDPDDTARVVAALGGFGTPHLWEWTPAGGWVALGEGLPDVPANTAVLRGDEVYVGTDTGVFRSGDRGRTFAAWMEGLPAGVVVNDLKLHASGILTAGTYGRGAWQIALPPLATAAPGRVDGLLLTRLATGEIEASWPPACNALELPGQTHSLQGGSLVALRAGTYDHAPIADRCDRVSPTTFVPMAVDAYYLVVPNEGGREGSAGFDSAGVPRPQVAATCGARQEGSCP